MIPTVLSGEVSTKRTPTVLKCLLARSPLSLFALKESKPVFENLSLQSIRFLRGRVSDRRFVLWVFLQEELSSTTGLKNMPACHFFLETQLKCFVRQRVQLRFLTHLLVTLTEEPLSAFQTQLAPPRQRRSHTGSDSRHYIRNTHIYLGGCYYKDIVGNQFIPQARS